MRERPWNTRALRASARAAAAFLCGARLAAALPQAPEDARGLFLRSCAQCHGESGDGQGTAQLDRPARSFKDGGFSYGNTPEALFRTISVGIPGTPMPAFDAALDEAQRRVLADYVVTLGPEVREVKAEETVLAVRDRPLVVRGKLPPIAEGAVEVPRGLLIGTTDGFTFEYRADDVRLLGVRQGDFVRRSDWGGRGGTPLAPLGKVLCTIEGGVPEPTFSEDGRALRAALAATRVRGDRASIAYRLVDGSGAERALVEESPRVRATPLGASFARHLEVRCLDTELALDVRAPSWDRAEVLHVGGSATPFVVVKPFAGMSTGESLVCVALLSPARTITGNGRGGFTYTPTTSIHQGGFTSILHLAAGEKAAVDIVLLPLSTFSDDVATELDGLFAR